MTLAHLYPILGNMSENTSKVQRIQELRRSNAAQPQDSRPKRQRTRATAKRRAIQEG